MPCPSGVGANALDVGLEPGSAVAREQNVARVMPSDLLPSDEAFPQFLVSSRALNLRTSAPNHTSLQQNSKTCEDLVCSCYPSGIAPAARQWCKSKGDIDNEGQQCILTNNQPDISASDKWVAERKRRGTTGRLITYENGEHPVDDFAICGGDCNPVVVSNIIVGGKAFFAGVKVGDLLASIDGERDFFMESASCITKRLSPPVTLVFMGFAGDLEAEVRLRCHRPSCGILSLDRVMLRPDEVHSTVQVKDEVIFQPTTAALLLTTTAEDPPAPKTGRFGLGRIGQPSNNLVYEIDNDEARVLVRHAVLRLGFYNPPEEAHASLAEENTNSAAWRSKQTSSEFQDVMGQESFDVNVTTPPSSAKKSELDKI